MKKNKLCWIVFNTKKHSQNSFNIAYFFDLITNNGMSIKLFQNITKLIWKALIFETSVACPTHLLFSPPQFWKKVDFNKEGGLFYWYCLLQSLKMLL